MQLTKSVCLYKLFNDGLEKALSEYESLRALELVNFEFLPHYNRHDDSFISLIKQYTKETGIIVYSCADGGAIVINAENMQFIGETYKIEAGEIMRI